MIAFILDLKYGKLQYYENDCSQQCNVLMFKICFSGNTFAMKEMNQY